MGFKPDYGSRLLAEGTSSAANLYFYNFHLFSLTVLSRSYYSTVVDTPYDGVLHALSLDFNSFQMEQILTKAEARTAGLLRAELSRDPRSPRSINLERPVNFGV